MQLLLSHKSLSWWPISQRQAYPGCYLIRIVLLQALHGHFHFQKSFLLCASALIKPMVFFIWGEVREGSHFSGCQWETIFLKTSQWVHGVAFRFCQERKRCCFVLPKALLQIKCEPGESRSLHFIISPSMPGGGRGVIGAEGNTTTWKGPEKPFAFLRVAGWEEPGEEPQVIWHAPPSSAAVLGLKLWGCGRNHNSSFTLSHLQTVLGMIACLTRCQAGL